MVATLLGLLLSTGAAARAPIGASVCAWRGGWRAPEKALLPLKTEGFDFASLVPTYVYKGNERIDFESGPSTAEVAGAVIAARQLGLGVVLKPHLDPPQYAPTFSVGASTGPAWRGQFDVDPMSPDYVAFVERALEALAAASRSADIAGTRLELGSELMRSEMTRPERWEALLALAKRRRRELGLDGKVLLSHNFAHHVEIPGDYELRMSRAARLALGRYVAALDAIALSQYMDLTAAMPQAQRARRLPTPEEVAAALRLHERRFEADVLTGLLGVPAERRPPLHLGEFGVGTGGLARPNEWAGETTPAQEARLALEIARADAGLVRYLSEDEGRLGRSAALWTLGRHYDVFGWSDPKDAVAPAAAALRQALRN